MHYPNVEQVFPEMNGCYAEEEVPQNGSGKRLEVMRYSLSDRSANFQVGEFNPYFGVSECMYVLHTPRMQ